MRKFPGINEERNRRRKKQRRKHDTNCCLLCSCTCKNCYYHVVSRSNENTNMSAETQCHATGYFKNCTKSGIRKTWPTKEIFFSFVTSIVPIIPYGSLSYSFQYFIFLCPGPIPLLLLARSYIRIGHASWIMNQHEYTATSHFSHVLYTKRHMQSGIFNEPKIWISADSKLIQLSE